MLSLQSSIAIMYILGWFSYLVGFTFIKSGTKLAKKLERGIWNARIDKLSTNPFKKMMDLYEHKKYFPVFFMVILININMIILQFILGLILLSPLMVAIQGFLIGVLLAQADRKTLFFGLFVLIFELGAFTSSAAIGLVGGINWLLMDEGIVNTLTEVNSGLIYLPFILLFLNALFEASGTIINVEGVPGITAVKNKAYK